MRGPLTTASASGYTVKLAALLHVSEIINFAGMQIGSEITSRSINRIKNTGPRIVKSGNLL